MVRTVDYCWITHPRKLSRLRCVFEEEVCQALTLDSCQTNMSDMAVVRIKSREFQRKTAGWLRRARQGAIVVIVSSQGPPLTLKAGSPIGNGKADWAAHFDWLKRQPILSTNPIDDARKSEAR